MSEKDLETDVQIGDFRIICLLQLPNSDGRTKWPKRQRTSSLTK
jgi:hypothetical protein